MEKEVTGLGLRIFGATDRGMARSVNEDRFAGAALAPDFGYGVVCDGVGGAKAGDVASTVARDEIRRGLEAACRPGIDQRSVGLMMESAISTANSLVYHRASQDPALLGGMGTTLCLAVVYDGGRVCIANVGDSRGYLLRGGSCASSPPTTPGPSSSLTGGRSPPGSWSATRTATV